MTYHDVTKNASKNNNNKNNNTKKTIINMGIVCKPTCLADLLAFGFQDFLPPPTCLDLRRLA